MNTLKSGNVLAGSEGELTMINRTALAVALLTIGTSVSAQNSSPTGFKMAQAQLNDSAKGACYATCQKVYNGCEPKGGGSQCMVNLNKCTQACDAPR